jgi:lipoprotein-anchoring transpeptidase ErfK/SrfK
MAETREVCGIGAHGGRHSAATTSRARTWWTLMGAALLVLVLAGGTAWTLNAGATPATRASASTAVPAQPAVPPAAGPSPTTVVTASQHARCPANAVACVDLSTKTAWLQDGGQVTYGPVPMLPGAQTGLAPPGPTSSATPTGAFHVLRKKADGVSSEFGDPMPNAVYFAAGGIAFHEGSLTTSSHGCIHLPPAASTMFFDRLRVGDPVEVFA